MPRSAAGPGFDHRRVPEPFDDIDDIGRHTGRLALVHLVIAVWVVPFVPVVR